MNSCHCESESIPIVLTDQLNRQVRVISFDPSLMSFKTLYTWTPTAEAGFTNIQSYTYPSDVRLRKNEQTGSLVFLTCASGGFCTMAEYPSGRCMWEQVLDPNDNPHAIELLPNGCIVIAASTGNFIRVYSADTTDCYEEYPFVDAHGLLWDPQMNVLWAVGKSRLSAFEIAGTSSHPVLTERKDLRAKVPIANGHDVCPVYGDTDRLWVIANVPFQYSKSERKWIKDYAGFEQLMQNDTKSCSSLDSVTIQTIADGTWQIWDTATIHVYNSKTNNINSFVIDDAAIYRARIWNAEYQ